MTTVPTAAPSTTTVPDRLAARRTASHRLPPLFCGRRDPIYPLRDREPSTFSLTGDELRAEANKLARHGWGVDEITAVLDIVPRPQAVAA